MYKFILSIILPLISLSLASCVMNRDKYTERYVQTVKLDNGKTVELGMKPIDDSMGCKLVDNESYSYEESKIEGSVNKNSYFGAARDKAIAFANKDASKNFNYIYIYMPNEYIIAGFSTGALAENKTQLFNCQNLAKPNNDPFNDKEDQV